jgi:DNA-directed RNA polymerase specialized sigma24 family protein
MSMDEQEFKQILLEGQIALKKERERIKNDPHRPRPWEEITPAPLKPAIEHIRKEFRTRKWQLSMQVECGCYLALHPELATAPKFKGLQNLIKPELRAGWRAKWETIKESERFHYWSEQFTDGLEAIIVEPFNSFLRIALVQQSALTMPPVEWAKVIANDLIYSLRWTVPHFIKGMCDEQENRADFDHETFDAYCAWVYWRAPRFIHMQPSGNTLYDRATTWHRESAELTEQLLRGLTDRMLDPARFKIDRVAGEAYVSLACSSPVQAPSRVQPPSIQNSPPTPSPASADVPSEAEALDSQIKPKVRLPTKRRDLSRYLDSARLTERQRDCISLKLEYGLTTTAIAQHLGISRKTVDEHIEAAKRNIDAARQQNQDKAKAARFNR